MNAPHEITIRETRVMADVKTGAQHIASLRDGRVVYLDGKIVSDVTIHPAFRGAVRSIGQLYDFQAAPENIGWMTFDCGGGRRVSRAWEMPRSREQLESRRRALAAWAQLSCGFIGRSPDHVASSLIGQVMGIEVFERHGPARAAALRDYVAEATRQDWFLTYVIINPQADRSKAWGEQAEADLTARIVDEDSGGITIRGGKMLGTSAIMANEVLVASLQPLRPGEEHLAFSCALPMNARGLKLLSRKSYEAHAVSEWDNPLSSRFDENDAVIWFDDVKVPWERVFVHRDTDMCRAQFHDTWAHTMQNYQAQIRLVEKLRFLTGLARRVAETIGTVDMPPVRDALGRLAARTGAVEAILHGVEAAGSQQGEWYVPNKHMVYAAQVVTQEMYPDIVQTIRELAGGGLIMLPSSVADYANPEVARIIRTIQQSPSATPDHRVKFMKLAWDAVGSEFASRHLQYEMFYAGAQFVTRGHSWRTYDWERAKGMVEQFMASYSLTGSAGPADHAA
jgi:4-hydroxyphenylacetate 3-monooxygenase